jgi:D-glycero-D-manno-heptose 1,7-bisphosphate phosphatase
MLVSRELKRLMSKASAVFFDRDGVLNEAIIREGKPYPPKNLTEFIIKPEAASVLKQLKAMGFLIFVVTNQPDIARATTSLEAVDVLNQALKKALPEIDAILVCPHDDSDECICRKPLPGLIFQAQERYKNLGEIDLSKSFMVGDRWRDIEAGERAGCKTIWMNFGYQEKQPEKYDAVTDSLMGVLNFILESK